MADINFNFTKAEWRIVRNALSDYARKRVAYSSALTGNSLIAPAERTLSEEVTELVLDLEARMLKVNVE